MGYPHMWRTTPVLVVSAFLGAVVALVSIIMVTAESTIHTRPVGLGAGAWVLVAIVGGVVEFGSFALHDTWHLRRGETPHAMWGAGDARRPSWIGGPRTPNQRH